MQISNKFRLILVFSLIHASVEATNQSDEEALLGLSLQELISLEVTSAGKKPQKLNEIPAAVFVVTQDDIRRSGATDLPDILRMVPGMHVTQINSHAWGISARGNNDYYANKMLVMIDGRSVYAREFSGVWWDQLNLVLEDIERIEVIRGPGGALWGANAVNGIVNIITKLPEDTQGGLLSVAAGDQLRYLTAVRYGGKIGKKGHFRVYGKGQAKETPDAVTPDPSDNLQTGFRFDNLLSQRDSVTLQGDYYRGRSREIDFSTYAASPADETYHGGNLLTRWTRSLDNGGEWQAQTYLDSYYRNTNFVTVQTRSLDVDIQHRFRPHERHELIWGANWRHYDQQSEESRHFRFIPADYTEELYSVFVQDEITLQAEQWHLFAGAKFEYTQQTDLEIQPSLRLLWTPTPERSLWTAASRAVRMPDWGTGRSEFRIYYPPQRNAFDPIPLYLQISPTTQLDSEYLTAYELGWRETLRENLLLDVTTFTHRYKKILNTVSSPLGSRPDGIGSDIYYRNLEAWNAYGTEWAMNWQAAENINVQAAYTYFNELLPTDYQHTEPKHQISLHGHLQFAPAWQVDTWLRYSGDIPSGDPAVGEVKHYSDLDLRLAWQATKNIEVSVVGRNLLHHDHHEQRWSVLNQLYLATERNLYAQVQWSYF